jgi:hypothetical protein
LEQKLDGIFVNTLLMGTVGPEVLKNCTVAGKAKSGRSKQQIEGKYYNFIAGTFKEE